MTDYELIGAVVGIAGTIVAFIAILVEHFHFNADTKTQVAVQIKAVETKVENMQNQIITIQNSLDGITSSQLDIIQLKTKVDLFWKALEMQLPSMLLKGNPLAPDTRVVQLLSKFHEHRIEDCELVELTGLIDCEIRNPEHSPGEALAMLLLNATIKSSIGVSHERFASCI